MTSAFFNQKFKHNLIYTYRFLVSVDLEQFHSGVFCWYFPLEKATIVEAEEI